MRAKPEEENMFRSVLLQQGLVLDLGVLNISLMIVNTTCVILKHNSPSKP